MQDDEIKELIYNESFLNYCFDRDATDVAYWQQWLREHPQFAEEVTELKSMVILMGYHAGGEELAEQKALLTEKMAAYPRHTPVRRMTPFRWVAAASVLFILSFGGYFLLHQPKKEQYAQVVHDLKPGSNKAVLTLANGKKIILTNTGNGMIATQGNASVTKTDSGKLVYSTGAGISEAITMNTLETPRGGTYFVQLADGTKVWLNAASKLVYPSAFTGSERNVTLTGEAVFEVKPNKAMPFHVKAAGHVFEDIGTQFNINAYSDEPNIKATLLEGSMRVDDVLLHPGQQARITGTKIKLLSNVDTDEVTAWKDGFFQFNDENLEGVMRKVSRWYNVDIEFVDAAQKARTFTWRVSRYKTVGPLLRKLQLTGGIHFTIENNKIIINN